MASFFERRRIRKHGREWLRHARHCRRMREDVAAPQDVAALRAAEEALAEQLRHDDVSSIPEGCRSVESAVSKLTPRRPYAAFRENWEVLVVAVAVAMAFRTYFLQPFKIPTGSMQPTLYGIHYTPQDGSGIMDGYPLRFAKWLAFGEWYVEYPAAASGVLRGPFQSGESGLDAYRINGVLQLIPRDLPLLCRPGQEVVTGQMLARGNEVTGDHLFVNRLKWNFCVPSRGEVMVFRTAGLAAYPGLTPDTHYIKRMCGLPGERITIRTPELLVNGKAVLTPEAIRRIEIGAAGYTPYHPAGVERAYIPGKDSEVTLAADEYLALGDNTGNSLDSRYWGPVPARNLVGPAMIVYWPFSRRWGPVQ